MKPLAPLVGFSFALVMAGLGSGCASSTPTATYSQPAQDFEVMESSAERPLTDSEKAEVRASVASYLDREGATEGGDYYLKVYLTPENVDAESEWVVVRFTRYTAQRVAVVNSYPYDSLTYSPYYSYDIYPYGYYGGVTRITFQYYVDPFYHQHYYYYPRHGYGGHKGGHGNAHHNGGKPGHQNGNTGPGSRPPGPPIASNPPRGNGTNHNPTYPRQSPPAGGGRQHYEDIQPRGRWNGRPGVDSGSPDVANTGSQPATATPAANPSATPSGHANPDNRDNRGSRGNRGDRGNRPGTPPPARVNSNPAPQGYASTNSPDANRTSGNPSGQVHRRNPSPGSSANVNKSPRTAERTAERSAPTGNRPQQVNRPAPAPARQAPAVQRAPERAAAPSSSSPARATHSTENNSDRQGGSNSRESLR